MCVCVSVHVCLGVGVLQYRLFERMEILFWILWMESEEEGRGEVFSRLHRTEYFLQE